MLKKHFQIEYKLMVFLVSELSKRSNAPLSTRMSSLLSQSIKKDFGICFLYTLIWGLLAHTYGFLHDTFSHDSLNALYADATEQLWKIQIGRIFVSAYRALTRGGITLPWLIGLLSLVWIAFSVYLIVKMFKVHSKPTIFLITGIFVANITVTATAATYIHDLDVNMFALLSSVLAVFLWNNYRLGFLPGAILVTLTLGLYQAMLLVSVTLIIFICIMDLLNQESFKRVLLRGVKGILMLLLGGGLYFGSLLIASRLFTVSMDTGTYNSVFALSDLFHSSTISYFIQSYLNWVNSFTSMQSIYPNFIMKATHILLASIVSICVIASILKKEILIKEKFAIIVLGMLIPLSMNMLYVLNKGAVHDLMKFSFWLIYLLAILIVSWISINSVSVKAAKVFHICKNIVFVLICVVLWSNIQTANAVYLKKDLEQEATLSLMTRVVYRMEATTDYISGKTPVAFVGVSDQINYTSQAFDFYNKITGIDSSQAITQSTATYYFNVYEAYFKYVLKNPAIMCDDNTWTALQENADVMVMPCYPASGCIKMMNGVLVVKMSN